MKDTSIHVALSSKQREEAMEKAEREGRTISVVVRALLGAWVRGKFDPWKEGDWAEEE